jgi:hypothetical protein
MPSYRLHRPSGRAIVSLDGRQFYLGKYGSAESKIEYKRLIREWLNPARRLAVSATAGGLTIVELIDVYWQHVESYYVKDGRPTSDVANIRQAMRVLKRLTSRCPWASSDRALSAPVATQ